MTAHCPVSFRRDLTSDLRPLTSGSVREVYTLYGLTDEEIRLVIQNP